jgi:hypothetical protein
VPRNRALHVRLKARNRFEEARVCKLRSVSEELDLPHVILHQSKTEQIHSTFHCYVVMVCSCDGALLSEGYNPGAVMIKLLGVSGTP